MEKQEVLEQLKREKDAVILAHYYVEPEVQAVADYIGDSFYLSRKATELPNRTLVFCGVSFMGESAKLLNPEKTVLLPDAAADCPMAHMVSKSVVDAARRQYDDLAVVCYINSTEEIKSWSDVCVTSANAVSIVKNLPNRHILFIPDKNLAHYVAKQVPEKEFIFNDGYCPVHEHMRAEEILLLKREHPKAEVLAHPECCGEVLQLADYIGSTSGIINYAGKSPKKEFIIATECGVAYALGKQRPDAAFYFPETTPVCRDMKKITLEDIIQVLKTGENEVLVNEKTAAAAGSTLTRMLTLAGQAETGAV